MSFLGNVGKILSKKSNLSPKELATVPANRGWRGENYNFSAWQGVSFDGSHDNVLTTNETVFSVITRLSNTLASLPIHFYRKDNQDDKGTTINLLRIEANENTSGYQLINETEVARNTNGNGYIWIQRDALMQPMALWSINPNFVVIERNTDDNSIWYRVSYDQFNILVPNKDMIHVKHIHPLSSIYGVSPIDVLRDSLKFQKSVEDFSLNEMSKKDSYVIEYDRSVDPDKRQAIINDFVKMIKANGGAVVQERGFKFDRFESKFNPADLASVEGISRIRIANAFDVPLSFVNDNSSNATTNVEHVMTQFVEMTLNPIIKQYESEFNRKLLTPNQIARGYYFKFNVNGLMRGDTAARTQFYQMMIRNGIATPNELRRLEDLPVAKDKNADKLWFSKDLALLDQADKINAPANTSAGQDETKGGDVDGPKDNQASGLHDNQGGSKQSSGRNEHRWRNR
uniref:phage portal protein n=1 Tax=Lactobacillus acidophilus TaxID=1579 RepID=UPI003F5512E1